jgi:fermentation-respiration switch protein FrsA (DUF1100 family)
MFTKHEVSFPAEGGVELSAWLYLPDARTDKLAGITMAHGYAGTKYHGIEPTAELFVKAGFAVLLHDHRGFGDSGGDPRQDVNPWQQITDWRRAISYLQDRPEVDENRIGLWGTSYAGGHAIVLGATDRRVKAVVAQVPTIDGHAAGQRRVPPERVAGLEALFAADERAQLRGEAPAYQTIVSSDAGENSSYRSDESVAFFLQPVPEGVWENKVTLRSTRWARMYHPGLFIDRVSPTPLMMVVAERDTTAATDLALRAYEQALQPKALVMVKGGHYDPYVAQLEAAIEPVIDWFREYL